MQQKSLWEEPHQVFFRQARKVAQLLSMGEICGGVFRLIQG